MGWLPSYNRSQLRGDLSAGLSVGVMLIPQGMAYAMIAGLPPIYGLYASTIPLIIYALLGTSRQLAVGPVAMVSLLTASGIGAIADAGTETFIALAIALALFVGLIQFLLGVFRLGFLVNFLSHPVISGFTSAAALIIGFSQLKHLLGIELDRSHHIHEILVQAVQMAPETNLITLAIGVIAILLIIGLRKVNKAIPGAIVALIFGIIAVWLFGLDENGVKIVGEVPKGLPSIGNPMVAQDYWSDLLPIALTIALVGFMESIAVAKAIQSKHRDYKVIPNKELIALGLANIGGSFFQSYPTTGGFSRTAVNNQAGAKTGMASIISAVLVILTLLFLTPLFYYLPNAILASVIMVAVFGLIDFKEARNLWRSDRTDFWMLIATFVATLSLGIEQGIGIGVILSLVMVIYRTTKPHVAVLGRIPGTTHYRNVDRFENLEQDPNLLIVRFDSSLYFANVQFFKDTIEQAIDEKGEDLKAVILAAESINQFDSSAAHAIDEVIQMLEERNVRLCFSGVKGPVRDTLEKAGIPQKLGIQSFFLSIAHAEEYFRSSENGKDFVPSRDLTLQTNNP